MKLSTERMAYAATAIGWTAYAVLSFAAPSMPNARYTLSSTQTVAIKISLILPMLLIWLIAVGGANAFMRYARRLKGSPEAPALSGIATGLYWLIAYFIVGAVIAEIQPFLHGIEWHNSVTIFRDHLAAAMTLIAFFLMYAGSKRLQRVAKFNIWDSRTAVILSAFAVFAIVFVFAFATTTEFDTAAINRSSMAILPRFLLLFTLIIPYFVGWTLAILSAINIRRFSTAVKGVLYRRALRDLVWGITAIVSFAVLVQCLTLSTKLFSGMSLGWLLVVVYLLVAMYALGFLFVRAGARKLARFEVIQ